MSVGLLTVEGLGHFLGKPVGVGFGCDGGGDGLGVGCGGFDAQFVIDGVAALHGDFRADFLDILGVPVSGGGEGGQAVLDGEGAVANGDGGAGEPGADGAYEEESADAGENDGEE